MNKTITRERLFQKLKDKEPFKIIEALPKNFFDAGHLPTALNIPLDNLKQRSKEILPNKEELIVVYCSNLECNNSNLAQTKLEEFGYTNVLEYKEGKQHWLEAELPIEAIS